MESRILQLISALRASGVRISLAESSEAFSAVNLMGVQDRESFRLSLRATLIKEARDIPVFDKLFPLFFGSSNNPPMGGDPNADLTPEEAQMLADALKSLSEKLREQMGRLMQGKPLSQQDLEQLARMTGLNNSEDLRHQNWMAQRMMRALSFPQVREALKELMETLAKMGMDRESVEQMRQKLQANMQGIQKQLEQFAGQRIAENISRRPPSEGVDGLMDRPFHSLSDGEKKLLQREVKRLAASLKTRIALRQKHARTGQLDPKATIRANQRYQGVPMEIRHRDRVRKPRIVVICDVSTSMRFCSELMLSFLFALQGQVNKTFAFAFIDHLESISEDFRKLEADQAIASVLARMPGGYYSTDLGWSLNDFNEDFMHTLNGQTTLLMVGDGRNNYNDPRIDLFSRMARRASRTIWLNPEPPALWQGDSDMARYAPLCNEVLKVSNLKELASAVDQLLSA